MILWQSLHNGTNSENRETEMQPRIHKQTLYIVYIYIIVLYRARSIIIADRIKGWELEQTEQSESDKEKEKHEYTLIPVHAYIE